jgi:hypothetical protein
MKMMDRLKLEKQIWYNLVKMMKKQQQEIGYKKIHAEKPIKIMNTYSRKIFRLLTCLLNLLMRIKLLKVRVKM